MHALSTGLNGGWRVTLLMRGGATRASSVLARRGRDVAVFDTGMAHHEAALLAALATHGVAAADVTLVFNTHGHFDHSHNNVLFSRARVFCSARDREWTRAVHAVLSRLDNPTGDDVLPFYPDIASGRYSAKIVRKILGIEKLCWNERRWAPQRSAVWLEETSLPDGIRVMETPGHSPHHVSFVIDTGEAPVLVCGDALLLRGEEEYTAPMMPPWSAPQYLTSRERITSFHGVIVPGHDQPFRVPAP
jgi:glyoxylase-like metal-dependent hydrolase (beta-lactamase superfamily II)